MSVCRPTRRSSSLVIEGSGSTQHPFTTLIIVSLKKRLTGKHKKNHGPHARVCAHFLKRRDDGPLPTLLLSLYFSLFLSLFGVVRDSRWLWRSSEPYLKRQGRNEILYTSIHSLTHSLSPLAFPLPSSEWVWAPIRSTNSLTSSSPIFFLSRQPFSSLKQ